MFEEDIAGEGSNEEQTSADGNGEAHDEAGASGNATDEKKTAAPVKREVVAHLNKLFRAEGNGKVAMGEYVLDQIFNNDLAEIKSKNPNKNKSYADLAKDEDLEVTAKELGRCVRAAVQKNELEAAGVSASWLSYSHLHEIGKAPTLEDRLDLADRVIAEKMKVKDITAAVK